MRLVELEGTDEIVDLGQHHRARRWKGHTEKGIQVDVYIAIVRVDVEHASALEAEAAGGIEEIPEMIVPAGAWKP